eukprot:TRINITY_DN64475_c0_g1_i1.p1 TRINITY_DN64475_c0_g1~~TRINITY_DN64475_c0_g1_i1.p1  ORF type:complete len:270 (-),score=56.01 TRINITY_DN64475_c0_g1_i1:64-873(-)
MMGPTVRQPIRCLLLTVLAGALLGRPLGARVDGVDNLEENKHEGAQLGPTLPAIVGVDLDLDGTVERHWTPELGRGIDDDEDAAKILSLLVNAQAIDQKTDVKSSGGPKVSLLQKMSNDVSKSSIDPVTTGVKRVALLQNASNDLSKRSAESVHSGKSHGQTEDILDEAIKAVEAANKAKQSVQQALISSENSILAVRAERGHVAPKTRSAAAEAAAEASQNVLAMAEAAKQASKGAFEAIEAAARTLPAHPAQHEIPSFESIDSIKMM